jgi:poly(3-hydroxybutyrate) depolymerase
VTAVVFLAWFAAVERLGAERTGRFNGLMPVASLTAVAVKAPKPISNTLGTHGHIHPDSGNSPPSPRDWTAGPRSAVCPGRWRNCQQAREHR